MQSPPSVDAVVLTALGVEFAAVHSHLSEIVEIVHKGTVYEVGRVCDEGPTIAMAEIGAGNVGAAFETERAIEFFQPRIVLFVGVAGGVKDVDIGDVVAATKVYGYESGKEDGTLRLRPDIGTVSYGLEQRARAVARAGAWRDRRLATGQETRRQFDALIGPIAAGEKVVADTASRTYRLIRDALSDTLAVEMEGIGTLRAVRANSGVECLVVRGISDLLDDKGLSDAAGSQPVAAASAAAFAIEVLVAVSDSSIPPAPPVPQAPEPAEQIWLDSERTASSLYPQGPLHDDVWSRSGGDVAALNLSGNGRSGWHRAFRTLRNGGGGTTLQRLLDEMAVDYSSHADLERLRRSVGAKL